VLSKSLFHYSIDPNRNPLFKFARIPVEGLHSLIGIAFGFKSFANKRMRILLYANFTLVALSVIWWVRNDWEAYFLPLLPALIIGQVIGMHWIVLKPGSKFGFLDSAEANKGEG
jgi:hypothetical protein